MLAIWVCSASAASGAVASPELDPIRREAAARVMLASSNLAPHPCCNTGSAGCTDPVVEAGVCDVDSFCCSTSWDGFCVREVTTIFGENCDCCLESATAEGCYKTGPGNAISDCVCASDPTCCSDVWDSTCVALVESLSCGDCAGCGPPPLPSSPAPADGAVNQPIDQDVSWSEVVPAAPSTSVLAGSASARANALTTLIDFDDLSQPCSFLQTMRATNEYATAGVIFEGPGGNDGGALLDECSGFDVTGHSSPNFLAFNPDTTMSDTGIPQPLETIQFLQGATDVQATVGSADPALQGALVTMIAYDLSGTVVDSDSVALAIAMAPISVAGKISYVEIDVASSGFWVLDDLSFESASDCTPNYHVYSGLSNPPTGLSCFEVMPPLTCDLGPLTPEATIYWRVVSNNADGSIPGPIWSFETDCADDDDDDICNDVDNCMLDPDPDQTDSDQDGYGNVCDPDLNNDGAVGILDFNTFRSLFGVGCGDSGYDANVDFDSDCAIGILDFNIFRSYFGGPPGPSGYACAGTIPCP